MVWKKSLISAWCLALCALASGGCCRKPKPSQPSASRPCATEPIPPLPDINETDIAGPEEGCDTKWEICLDPQTARKIEKYHNALRRAALLNARLCNKGVAPTAE